LGLAGFIGPLLFGRCIRRNSNRRPELKAALKAAKKLKCEVAVAKLDRLSRDVAFIANLMSQRVPFIVHFARPQRRPVHPAHLHASGS
jgi:hypothetical protein